MNYSEVQLTDTKPRKPFKTVIDNLKRQGWEVRPLYVGKFVTYEAKHGGATVTFTNNGRISSYIYWGKPDLAKISFVEQQLRAWRL